jgi:acyl dehydratase
MQTFEVESMNALTVLMGHALAISDWMVLTHERATRFAEVTEDLQWIHADSERAQRDWRDTVEETNKPACMADRVARRLA